MASYQCIVQEGLVGAGLRARLGRGLARLDADTFGLSKDAGTVEFVEIRRGSGFTAGEASTTSIVYAVLPDGCPTETRKRLMASVCEIWYETTGCSPDGLVVFTADRP